MDSKGFNGLKSLLGKQAEVSPVVAPRSPEAEFITVETRGGTRPENILNVLGQAGLLAGGEPVNKRLSLKLELLFGGDRSITFRDAHYRRPSS